MGMSDIGRASFDEARRLDHHWVGPEHGLLAILRGDPQDVARRVLEEEGLDAGTVERWLEPRGKTKEERSGALANPAWHHVFGRAEGFAACLASGEVQPVHLLLALLWDAHQWQFAERAGVRREAVTSALTRHGVALPTAPQPDLYPPANYTPHSVPSACQFCGGPIREGQRFALIAKDASWDAFFCSSPCSLGFATCVLVIGGQPRGADQPPLAEEFGTSGSWFRRDQAAG